MDGLKKFTPLWFHPYRWKHCNENTGIFQWSFEWDCRGVIRFLCTLPCLTWVERIKILYPPVRILAKILKIGVKVLSSRKSWSFSILFYWGFAKNWSQRQKVGVKYSKFGVNENSACDSTHLGGNTGIAEGSQCEWHKITGNVWVEPWVGLQGCK